MNLFQSMSVLLLIIFTAGLLKSAIIKNRKRFLKLFFVAIALTSIYFILFPNQTNVIANAVGIQRGADLISYLFIILFLYSTFSSYLKNQKLDEQITTLNREIALLKNKMKKHD